MIHFVGMMSKLMIGDAMNEQNKIGTFKNTTHLAWLVACIKML